MEVSVLFRADDVAFGSDVDQLREIRDIFEKHGLKEMYSVVTVGKNLYEGDPFAMPLRELEEKLGFESLLSDKKVVEFIRESLDRGHSISLHGWKHITIADFSANAQYEWVMYCKHKLENYFKTKIKYFVPPYNNFSHNTQLACEDAGLTILGTSEDQLERSVREDRDFNKDAPYYWYHAWRFYQNESLTPRKLDQWLEKYL